MDIFKYAVSDEKGHYVFYTDDLSQARAIRNDIDKSLIEENVDGCAAIMRITDDLHYELYL